MECVRLSQRVVGAPERNKEKRNWTLGWQSGGGNDKSGGELMNGKKA